MAKSHTRKKFVKRPPAAEPPSKLKQVTSATTDYIKQWTQRELSKIQKDDTTTICIPTLDGYRVGSYRLKVYPNRTCDILDHNQEFLYRFESKISAILYAIYSIKRRYYLADELVRLNSEINKSYTDMLNLQHSLELAKKSKDYVTVDVRQARLDIAENRLKEARDKILKIHHTAKLNKVWQ